MADTNLGGTAPVPGSSPGAPDATTPPQGQPPKDGDEKQSDAGRQA